MTTMSAGTHGIIETQTEQHAHEADPSELVEPAEVGDRERAVRDRRHARAHELRPQRVLHRLATRVGGLLPARTELAIPREQARSDS